MKKIFISFLLFILCLCGCATDPDTYYFDASYIINQATKIQLVVCENNNPINIKIKEDTVLFF